MKLSPTLMKDLEEMEARLADLQKKRQELDREIDKAMMDLEIIYRVIKELKRNEDNQETE